MRYELDVSVSLDMYAERTHPIQDHHRALRASNASMFGLEAETWPSNTDVAT